MVKKHQIAWCWYILATQLTLQFHFWICSPFDWCCVPYTRFFAIFLVILWLSTASCWVCLSTGSVKELNLDKSIFRLGKGFRVYFWHLDKCYLLVQSGHLEFQSLYATNDMVTPAFTINRYLKQKYLSYRICIKFNRKDRFYKVKSCWFSKTGS